MPVRVAIFDVPIGVTVGMTVGFGVTVGYLDVVVVGDGCFYRGLGLALGCVLLVGLYVKVHEEDDEDGRVEDEARGNDPVEREIDK